LFKHIFPALNAGEKMPLGKNSVKDREKHKNLWNLFCVI